MSIAFVQVELSSIALIPPKHIVHRSRVEVCDPTLTLWNNAVYMHAFVHTCRWRHTYSLIVLGSPRVVGSDLLERSLGWASSCHGDFRLSI